MGGTKYGEEIPDERDERNVASGDGSPVERETVELANLAVRELTQGRLPANRQLPTDEERAMVEERMGALVDDLASLVAELAFEGRLTEADIDEHEPRQSGE